MSIPSSQAGSGSRPQSKMKTYCLVDPQTQIPILSCQIPAHWNASGSTNWNLMDKNSFISWRMMFSDPQTGAVAMCSSTSASTSLGLSLEQVPMLREQEYLAQQSVPEIYQLAGGPVALKLFEATFSPGTSPQVQEINRQLTQLLPNLRRQVYYEYQARWGFYRENKGPAQTGKSPWGVKLHLHLTANENCDFLLSSVLMQILQPYLALAPIKTIATWDRDVSQALTGAQDNPVWTQLYQRLTQEVIQASNIGFRQRQRILNQHLNSARQTRHQSHSSVSDRVSRQFSDYIRDSEEATNPFDSNYTVELSNNSEHAWVNSSNEVLYTDSSLFNPNQESLYNSVEWRQMK